MSFAKSCVAFLRETRRDFFHTGAVMPSSRFLGRALASPLSDVRPAARILEVGPGTGAVTVAILRHLQPGDSLDIVEINDRFIQLLRRRLEIEEPFRKYQNQIRLIHLDVSDLNGDRRYDYIVSGLPLNNFPAELVRRLFRTFRRLIAPSGTLSFFEYAGIRQMKTPFVSDRERRRLSTVGHVVSCYVKRHQVRQSLVLANVPPAFARHLRFGSKPS